MSGHLPCFENFAYSAYFGWNLDKLTKFSTGIPNFSGPSNNLLLCSEVKPSILKSACSTTLSLYTIKLLGILQRVTKSQMVRHISNRKTKNEKLNLKRFFPKKCFFYICDY